MGVTEADVQVGQRWRERKRPWRLIEIIPTPYGFSGDPTVWGKTVEHRTKSVIGNRVCMHRETLTRSWRLSEAETGSAPAQTP